MSSQNTAPHGSEHLLTLPPNWDSYGAGAIDPNVVHDAMNYINGLLGPTSPAPRVIPLSSGGLQVEWHRNGVDLEVVFDRGEAPFFYFRALRENPTGGAILRSFLYSVNGDEFDVGHCHPLGLQE